MYLENVFFHFYFLNTDILSLYSTRTQNIWRRVLLRHLTQKNSTSASPNARIPICWYLKCENLRFPTPNLKFALAPTPNPDASQWNIGCVGSQRKMLALAMYISCFLCRFHLRLVSNANPISGGIWALVTIDSGS